MLVLGDVIPVLIARYWIFTMYNIVQIKHKTKWKWLKVYTIFSQTHQNNMALRYRVSLCLETRPLLKGMYGFHYFKALFFMCYERVCVFAFKLVTLMCTI